MKTLRNMWVAVSVINPLMALVAISVLSKAQIDSHQEALLSQIGLTTWGSWLSYVISIDAVLVLSGAVLTSYVGVAGLVKRIALDRVLPQFTLKENKQGAAYRIILMFFLLCVSILFVTEGELGALAGVYTISFLSVMTYFGVGNFLLKMIAITAVVMAIYGNIKLHPEYLVVFLQYFVPSLVFIILMLNRKELLKVTLVVIDSFFDTITEWSKLSRRHVTHLMNRLSSQQFVYFSKADSVASLNKVMMYVQENEATTRLKIVTILKNEKDAVSAKFLQDLEVLDRAYPELHIEFVQLIGIFSPELIQKLSREWKIPINFMFIASPGDKFPYKVSELGGVRLII